MFGGVGWRLLPGRDMGGSQQCIARNYGLSVWLSACERIGSYGPTRLLFRISLRRTIRPSDAFSKVGLGRLAQVTAGRRKRLDP